MQLTKYLWAWVTGLIFLFMSTSGVQAQVNPFKGKKTGVYFSSKGFSYPEELYLYVNQFIKVDDEGAWAGQQKEEFMIRLGWLLCDQLQALTGADSMYFLNADLPKGKAFRDAYDPVNNRMITPEESLKNLDYILVISPFELTTRVHKSVFIRSNRMVTDRIDVKILKFQTSLFRANGDRDPRIINICFDEQTGPKPVETYFDFYRKDSSMGKFLSWGFSHWWDAVASGSEGNCE
ncbi:MAG: hypothetical protein KDD63_23050 [Bacteroidetes bacterium]|nr:hypothetical protein [Bacteroidota bacterium]